MKHTKSNPKLFTVLLFFCSFYLMAESFAQNWTADYSTTLTHTQVLEKDVEGNPIQSTLSFIGKGNHSLLGQVNTLTIIRMNQKQGDNLVEFTETDQQGNSLFITGKGFPGDRPNSWLVHGVITGGTGIFQDATGSYTATGESKGSNASWTAEGVIHYTTQDEQKEAIKAVIIQETSDYMKKDIGAIDKLSVQQSYATRIVNMPKGTVIKDIRYPQNKIPERPANIKEQMVDVTNPDRTNWNIQIRGQVAWAIFDQTLQFMGSTVPSVETRILEKLNGAWKLSYSNTAINYDRAVPPLQN